MPRKQAGQGATKPAFTGFERPSANYFRMPTSWTDITASIDNLAELKVVEYVLRHTWGYQEYGIKKHITMDEFVHGRRKRDGVRMDRGTGLSERAVRYGLAKAVEHGLIEEDVDDTDRGRVKKWYGLRMREHTVDEYDAPERQSMQPGVQSLHPDLQDVPTRGAGSNPRSEKHTSDRNQQHVDGVIELLRNFGISKPTADRLATSYPEGYILAKLDLVQWLAETRSSLVAKNPAGYLRRALEEDYQPPPAYKPPAQRQAEATAKHRQLELEQEQRREAEAEFLRTREQARKALAKEYPPQEIPGTQLTTESAWQAILDHLHQPQVMTDSNFNVWLKETALVSCDGAAAVIAAPSSFQVEHLAKRFAPLIEKELRAVLGFKVSARYLALSDLSRSREPDQPQPAPRATDV